jgi:hypothetical protein
MSSQDLIAAQIPWATAIADRSRREREREKVLLYAQDTEHVRHRTVSQTSLNALQALGSNPGSRTGSTASVPLSTGVQGDDLEQTTEERLLGALLDANEELLGALKQYDDLKRVADEKRVEIISRREKRVSVTSFVEVQALIALFVFFLSCFALFIHAFLFRACSLYCRDACSAT